MQNLRNIAIIAHVDHGKTTLVDKMILQGNLFRDNEKTGELILDNNDLERERGITILSKNVSVNYKGIKINIIDTPGHSDFGGEVERVLNMADGVLLLVDAFEGTMPQTRFVLQKALSLGKKPIVVVNKVDKPNCRPEEVYEQVFDLMFTLNATEDQLDFVTIYGSAKQGWMSHVWKERTGDITPLLDAIIDNIPAPQQKEGTPQLLITSLEYSPYVGRIAVGKLTRGTLKSGMPITLAKRDGKTMVKTRIKDLMVFDGLSKTKVERVECGEICALVGIEGFEIGDTICDFENPEPLEPIAIDEPTMSMLFTINDSPFFGKEGKYVTSRHIKERLDRELEKNLALRVVPGASSDSFIVYGRGVLHLSVLIETMRREGYELQVGQPKVIIKEIDGKKCEPVEELTIDIPEAYSGKAIELVTKRKGTLLDMTSIYDRQRIVFEIPSRGIIGLRSNLLTATAGEAVMSHRLKGFEPYKGDMEMRQNGSLIAMETGTAYAYAINKLQDRGTFFVSPQDEIYAGQVVGESTRQEDIVINLTKSKKLTNMRASGSDDKVSIAPPVIFSLEEALEYIKEDEYVEVTPKSIRLRKIVLNETERKRQAKQTVENKITKRRIVDPPFRIFGKGLSEIEQHGASQYDGENRRFHLDLPFVEQDRSDDEREYDARPADRREYRQQRLGIAQRIEVQKIRYGQQESGQKDRPPPLQRRGLFSFRIPHQQHDHDHHQRLVVTGVGLYGQPVVTDDQEFVPQRARRAQQRRGDQEIDPQHFSARRFAVVPAVAFVEVRQNDQRRQHDDHAGPLAEIEPLAENQDRPEYDENRAARLDRRRDRQRQVLGRKETEYPRSEYDCRFQQNPPGRVGGYGGNVEGGVQQRIR